MKRIYLLLATFMLSLHCISSENTGLFSGSSNTGIFRDVGAGVSLGTGGLGIDLSTHVTGYVRLRAGVDYMPEFTVPMNFGLESYTDNGGVNTNNFSNLQNYMKRLSGIDVDDNVAIDGKPHICNFKFLVDVYPFKGKGWRVTAGFYWGSRKIATARNTIEEMPSLLAVNIYNNFYDYFMETDFYETPIYQDYYLDPFLVEDIRAQLEGQGRMGIHIGDFKDGRPYMMKPDTDGMVKANAFVNAFRPYVGLGYTTPIGGCDSRFKFDVDCGIMMWGGSPEIITHDGVNMGKDLVNIRGKIGDYVDIANSLKVYPMVSVRFSYTIF